jgi:hypothetical protein
MLGWPQAPTPPPTVARTLRTDPAPAEGSDRRGKAGLALDSLVAPHGQTLAAEVARNIARRHAWPVEPIRPKPLGVSAPAIRADGNSVERPAHNALYPWSRRVGIISALDSRTTPSLRTGGREVVKGLCRGQMIGGGRLGTLRVAPAAVLLCCTFRGARPSATCGQPSDGGSSCV